MKNFKTTFARASFVSFAIALLFLITAVCNAGELPSKRDLWKQHTKTIYSIDYVWQLTETHADQYKVFLDGGKGDCDDYAATNFARVKAKWPKADARVYEVWVTTPTTNWRKKETNYHAVTVVVVDGKKWVMDNMTTKIWPFSLKRYKWTRWTTDFKTWHAA